MEERSLKKRLRHWVRSERELGQNHRLRNIFGRVLRDPDLWHLNRYSVSWAVSVGLFVAFVPVPFQMLLAAAAAIVIGCNLPIAISIVWITNPLTIPPLFFAAYKFGAWLLQEPPRILKFEISLDWLLNGLGAIWQPFLLGCFSLGLLAALLGHLVVRIIWRIHVISSWQQRQARRRRRPSL